MVNDDNANASFDIGEATIEASQDSVRSLVELAAKAASELVLERPHQLASIDGRRITITNDDPGRPGEWSYALFASDDAMTIPRNQLATPRPIERLGSLTCSVTPGTTHLEFLAVMRTQRSADSPVLGHPIFQRELVKFLDDQARRIGTDRPVLAGLDTAVALSPYLSTHETPIPEEMPFLTAPGRDAPRPVVHQLDQAEPRPVLGDTRHLEQLDMFAPWWAEPAGLPGDSVRLVVDGPSIDPTDYGFNTADLGTGSGPWMLHEGLSADTVRETPTGIELVGRPVTYRFSFETLRDPNRFRQMDGIAPDRPGARNWPSISGADTIVLTSDGYLVVGRRQHRAYLSGSRWSTSVEECLEIGPNGDTTVGDAVRRGLFEELGEAANLGAQVTVLSIGRTYHDHRDHGIVQGVAAMALAELNATWDELKASIPGAHDSFELAAVVGIRPRDLHDLERLPELIEQYGDPFAVARALGATIDALELDDKPHAVDTGWTPSSFTRSSGLSALLRSRRAGDQDQAA